MDVSDLKKIPLLEGLSRRDMKLLSRHTDEVSIPAGTVIMREGDMAWEVCILLEGSVRVTYEGNELAELGPGDIFGEMGVMVGLHRTATVTTTADSRLAVLFGPEFKGVSAEIDELRRRVGEIIEQRRSGGGGDPS